MQPKHNATDNPDPSVVDPDASEALNGRTPLPNAMHPVWQQALQHLPAGIAILEGAGGTTVWINKSLQTMLASAAGAYDLLERLPADYLPNLPPDQWADAVRKIAGSAGMTPPRRLQFVHYETRNITYWEWTLTPLDGTPSYLMLTVYGVSDLVMNERMLASEARRADRARSRAETLMRVTQLVNVSTDVPDLLRSMTEEACALFDTACAAVLLLQPGGKILRIGYGVGLQEDRGNDTLPVEQSLAGEAIAQRRTLVTSDNSGAGMLRLRGGAAPSMLISSPIAHGSYVYGALEVYFDSPRDVSDEMRSVLSSFADQAAIALHRADLVVQIQEQKRRLQSIFDNAPVSILYFDTDLRVVAVNAEAARHLERSVEDLLNRHCSEFLTDVPLSLMEAARSGTPFHASHHVHASIPGPDGAGVSDLSILPVRNEQGVVVGVLALRFDITEQVKARQEADAARNAAEGALEQARAAQAQMVQLEKMRAVGELASGIAHDFNNALMAILGYTELAEDSLDEPLDLAGYLAVIKKASLDASSTVLRLQKFARQRIAANGEPTDVNTVVQDVIELTRPRWRDSAQRDGRTYAIHRRLTPLPLIHAEPSGLREVLVNLVHNALNAMPGGGELTLQTRLLDPQQVEIEVQDTGVGMAPDVMPRIFDPFFTTRGVEGTGLGLAVSWTIIQRHGGTIDVESEPGVGSRFFIRLPVALEEMKEPAPLQPRFPETPVQARILVVDDEPFVASVLTSILNRNGHRVTVAHSADEALRRLRAQPDEFQLVLTDHGMPGMTGLQLVEAVKRSLPHLPILLLTGWGENLLQEHVTDTLPDAILGKPINQSDLLNAVATVLRKSNNEENETGGP